MAARGRFITFEGGEGAGKSTQIGRLCERLESLGIEVVQVREPGGTALGEEMRRILADTKGDSPTDRAEALLFLAARAQLVEKMLLPALERGAWVVSDRFSDSTIAYQGYGRGLDVEALERMNAFACAGLRPDVTLFLDLPRDVAVSRMRAREIAAGGGPDRIESAGDEFHARVAEGFRRMAAAEPGRFATIDASGGEEAVWEAIWKRLKPLT